MNLFLEDLKEVGDIIIFHLFLQVSSRAGVACPRSLQAAKDCKARPTGSHPTGWAARGSACSQVNPSSPPGSLGLLGHTWFSLAWRPRPDLCTEAPDPWLPGVCVCVWEGPLTIHSFQTGLVLESRIQSTLRESLEPCGKVGTTRPR